MSKTKYLLRPFAAGLIVTMIATLSLLVFAPSRSWAAEKTADETSNSVSNPFDSNLSNSGKQCGKGGTTYTPVIDIGCQGNDYKGEELNPIMDMLFAILRFLTIGVGLMAIGSVIFAGIQFTTSRGDPGATAKAIGRIGSTVGALLLYVIAWALINWLIPGGVFNG